MDRFVLQGITHPGTFELSQGMLSVGRNPTNDLRISDPAVSSFHCEIILSDETVLVRDLNSTNGTFVDGERIQEAFLKTGQILRLGTAELRLFAEPVVAIPELPQVPVQTETHLLDGRLACVNHPGVEALLKCVHCGQAYCAQCVKPLGLKGAQKRLFCPACSNPCVPLRPVAPTRKSSLLGRLTQTIRIKFK